MITEKLSARRVARLTRVFQLGASQIASLLKNLSGFNSSGNLSGYKACLETGLKSLFAQTLSQPNPWTKLPGQSHNSIHGAGIAELLRQVSQGAVNRLTAEIEYSDLLIEAILTDRALVTVTREILAVRFNLPVSVSSDCLVFASVYQLPWL
jgi:hypothetical protein